MNTTNNKKLYICSIRGKNMFKRIFCEGDANQDTEELFLQLQHDIPEIGEKSAGWEDFYKKIIENFQSHGFTQVAG